MVTTTLSTEIMKIQGLTKTIPNRDLPVLNDINLRITEGKRYLIKGPSGSGKSSLLHIMGFIDHPTIGHVYYRGKDITTFTAEQIANLRNRNIGIMFQAPYLLPQFNVLDNILLPHHITQQPTSASFQEYYNEIFETLGIIHILDENVRDLSGGELQRVSLARALINKPELLLADEPDSQLDEANAKRVINLLNQIHKKHHTTIVLITHRPSTWMTFDKVIELRDGRIKYKSNQKTVLT